MMWLYVAAGGAFGALARYGVTGWVQDRSGFEFPWGTLSVNMLGSVMIGLSLRYLDAAPVSPEVRALVSVGLLGAFTTFSTFSYEIVSLLEAGAFTRAFGYALGSLFLGVIAVYVGMWAAGFVIQVRG